MSKNLSAKYYQENEENYKSSSLRIEKNIIEREHIIKIF